MDQIYIILAGAWLDFMSYFLFSDLLIFIVFSPKTISVLVIVEYSTISMLEYF